MEPRPTPSVCLNLRLTPSLPPLSISLWRFFICGQEVQTHPLHFSKKKKGTLQSTSAQAEGQGLTILIVLDG